MRVTLRPWRSSSCDVPGLVLEAALADELDLWVIALRPACLAGQGGAFQISQVLAGEKANQVAGRVDRFSIQ